MENRRFSRKDDCLCAWLLFEKDPAAYGTTTVDVGVEGARFIANKNVEVGEKVSVSLQLPSTNVNCSGRVCWQDIGSFTFGVCFSGLRDEERNQLLRYLNEDHAAAIVAETGLTADAVF